MKRFGVGLWRGLGLVWATLREIFDEAAYERYLVRAGEARSVESYADFVRQRNGRVKVRCC